MIGKTSGWSSAAVRHAERSAMVPWTMTAASVKWIGAGSVSASRAIGAATAPGLTRAMWVRDLLGHASIVTTERYDNQRLEALQAAVARLEEGKAFDAGRVKAAPHIRGSHGQLVRRSSRAQVCEGGSFKKLSSSDRTEPRRRLCYRERNPQK
jgi:hypothetical protein